MAQPSRSSRRKDGISRGRAEDGRELSLGREPVAENLLFAIGGGADAGEGGGVELAVFFEVRNRDLDGAVGFRRDQTRNIASQARAVFEKALDFQPRLPDGSAPAVARRDGRRVSKLCMVLDDPRNPAAQRRTLRDAQPFDLLGKVLPVEPPVRAAVRRRAQRRGLLLRPGDEILVVEGLCIGHGTAVPFVPAQTWHLAGSSGRWARAKPRAGTSRRESALRYRSWRGCGRGSRGRARRGAGGRKSPCARRAAARRRWRRRSRSSGSGCLSTRPRRRRGRLEPIRTNSRAEQPPRNIRV